MILRYFCTRLLSEPSCKSAQLYIDSRANGVVNGVAATATEPISLCYHRTVIQDLCHLIFCSFKSGIRVDIECDCHIRMSHRISFSICSATFGLQSLSKSKKPL